jgi:hypothetical protein
MRGEEREGEERRGEERRGEERRGEEERRVASQDRHGIGKFVRLTGETKYTKKFFF